MAPTTATDSTLVSNSITRSLDWMLTRESTCLRDSEGRVGGSPRSA